jgi:hypothetical protein
MSDAVSKAFTQLLSRLNDPLHQGADENAERLYREFKNIEREWEKAFEPELLKAAYKRLAATIEGQEDFLAEEAVAAIIACREHEHIIGKSARLMSIRRIIERNYPQGPKQQLGSPEF